MNRIVAEIERDAEAEVKRVLAEAQVMEEKRLDAARGEAGREATAILERAGREAAVEEKKALSAAHLKVKRRKAVAVDAFLVSVQEACWAALPEWRETPAYAKKLNASIEAAAKELGGKGVRVLVAPGDKRRVKVHGVAVEESGELVGGAIVSSAEGDVSVDVSMETGMEKAWPALKKELVALLGAAGTAGERVERRGD